MSDTVKIIIEIPKPMYENIQNGTYCGTLYKELKKAKLYETVTEFADRCRECGREKVLDKIRAEIKQEYNRLSATRADETLEVGECLGLKMALKIVGKYKAESEE